jgi:hypothetical protein
MGLDFLDGFLPGHCVTETGKEYGWEQAPTRKPGRIGPLSSTETVPLKSKGKHISSVGVPPIGVSNKVPVPVEGVPPGQKPDGPPIGKQNDKRGTSSKSGPGQKPTPSWSVKDAVPQVHAASKSKDMLPA